ncbi:MAG: hypothetical protein U0Y68_10470 [Blastocatellia bacterium]
MNYFNYFTEVEEEFVRRRGKHLLVSPLDWALIETWKQRGVPLRIALRGINQAFDIYDQKPRKFGQWVNNLFYCQQAVEKAYQQYLESHVGGREENGAEDEAQPEEIGGFSIANLKLALHEWQETLTRLSISYADDILLAESFDRAARRLEEISHDLSKPNDDFLGQMDADLNLIESFLLDAIQQHASAEKLAELRAQGEKDLKSYRKNMDKEIYEQTLNNWIARKLRDEYRVPRLGLFYL